MLVAFLHLHCVCTMFSMLVPLPQLRLCGRQVTGILFWGSGRRELEGRCPFTLLTVDLGLLCLWSLLLIIHSALSFCARPYWPWGLPPAWSQECQQSRSDHLFRTFLLCSTMGVALAACPVSGTPAEQEWRTYAVPSFPLHWLCFFSWAILTRESMGKS